METKETWSQVKGYENLYEISNYGKVKSLSRLKINGVNSKYLSKEMILKSNPDSTGYPTVNLFKNGTSKGSIKVHYLMAITFLGYEKTARNIVIDHIDNNKENNFIGNLQVITNRLNTSKDQKNCSSKYTGVTWDKQAKNWRSAIRIKDKKINLGNYLCEKEASLKYIEALNNIVN